MDGPKPVETMDLTGGAPCLDFANTRNGRAGPGRPVERLNGFADMVTWAERTGVAGQSAAARMRAEARARPEDADRTLQRAIELREGVFRIFAALDAGKEPDPVDLKGVEEVLRRSGDRRHLRPAGGRFEWDWSLEGDPLEWVLGPVAESAVELLRSAGLDRIKQCQGEGCNWLFVDSSRNRSRRWCDMRDCGNRAKARRHYARSKKT